MKKKYFGTDGIRGVAYEHPMEPNFLEKLSCAIFESSKIHLRKIIIGRDTRVSGTMIEQTIVKTFINMGVDCTTIGIVSTPILSFYTKINHFDLGIMITASHNPYHDNGIKIFDRNGEKLSDKNELLIEKSIGKKLVFKKCKVGKIVKEKIYFDKYLAFLSSNLPRKINLKKIKIFLDCANGSISYIAPNFFKKLGANIVVSSCQPDGKNINKNCGATFPKVLSKLTIKNKADIGLSFDGDADRVMISDENGEILDGDDILLIISNYLHSNKQLKKKCIVSTKMSNLGFRSYLKKKGIDLFLTKVGDRYVVEKMKKVGAVIGGEKSGHIIFSNNGYSGDGILTSLFLLSIIKESNLKMSQISNLFDKVPQKLINLKLKNTPNKILSNNKLKKKINNYLLDNSYLTDILVRKSGTENVLRIMVQCENKSKLNYIIQDISNEVKSIDDKKK